MTFQMGEIISLTLKKNAGNRLLHMYTENTWYDELHRPTVCRGTKTRFACITQYVALKRSTEKRVGRGHNMGVVGRVHTTCYRADSTTGL